MGSMAEADLGLPPSMISSSNLGRDRTDSTAVGRTKSNRKGKAVSQTSSLDDVDRAKLEDVVRSEMKQLKDFIKEIKGTRQNDPDRKYKAFYRDKYKQKYLGQDPGNAISDAED